VTPEQLTIAGRFARAASLRGLPLLLAPIPFICLVSLVVKYRVDVPYWDQWLLVPYLQRAYEGHLAPRDFLTLHAEHRPVFPRPIMLLLARATGWSISYELALNLLLALGIFAVLAWQIGISRRLVGARGSNWALPVASLVVFSPNQWENWLWGWQIALFLNLLAVVAGVALLARAVRRWWYLPAAMVLGIVASFSFACGLIYWVAALPAVVARPPEERHSARRSLVAWLLVAAAVLAVYLYHYHTPSSHPSVRLFLTRPHELAAYVLAYLGSPVSARYSLYAGLAGLAALLATAWRLRRMQPAESRPLLLPYVCLSLYAVLAGAMTGVGRMGFGVPQALSPRYITISNLLWISDLVLLSLLAGRHAHAAGVPEPDRGLRRAKAASAAGLAVIVLCSLESALQGVPFFAAEYHKRILARQELCTARDVAPRSIYPPQQQQGEVAVLRRLHLSVFRKGRR
jgi:hypothetical protein